MPGLKWQEIKQMLNNTLRINFWHPKIIGTLHPCYHLAITRHILKNKQKNKHVCINEIMQSIIMKMKTKMKIDSRKYGKNRPRFRHGHKYSEYMKRLSMMMLICINQHLRKYLKLSLWAWGWVEKSAAYKKGV